MVIRTGLGGVALGSGLMAVLPGMLGVSGYVASLALITLSYALFQAATNTAVMNGTATDQRGVTSALLALARNLGLVTGASAMGALYALGASGAEVLGQAAGGAAGLRLTFTVAAALAAVAWLITSGPPRRRA
jgi:hypothetical protein